jgi:iron complex outermembrane receptor protein
MRAMLQYYMTGYRIYMTAYRSLLLAGALALAVAPLLAQETPSAPPAPRAAQPDDDYHGPIVVSAGGLSRLDMLAGTSVLSGQDLQRNLNGQVGEVLARLPGLSATSFSPGASRPVLRGFQGERVRVLVDGIGSIDASNTSTDHAVTIDPLTAERIEVVRGPAVLLYGSSAIGGAVNVIDKRIPRRLGHETLHVDALAAIDTAYDLREGGASLDMPLGGGFAAHVDGSWRKTDDVKIAGYTLASPLRAEVLEAADEEAEEGHLDEAEELREAAGRRGILPNSASETKSAGGGLAWIGERANLGLSVGYYETDYGVPGRPGAGHHHESEEEEEGEGGHGEEAVSIGLEQFRADLRGSFDFGGGPFSQASTRWGYSDYRHIEFEGEEVGTTFDVEGFEGRVELIQRERGGWRGSVGGQYMQRDFSAVGAEAFVPPNATEQLALFTLQEIERGPFEVEFGGRWERTDVAAPTLGLAREFDTFSLAGGLSHEVAEGFRLGANVSRSERAPSAEELFADGPHIATQQFELGDPALRKETAWGVEGYLRGTIGESQLSLAAYRNWFDDFVYLQATGLEEDGLPVFRQAQQDADWFGVEAEASVPLLRRDTFTVVGDIQGDYVRATLGDGSPVPRIPPLSLRGGFEYQSDPIDVRAELEWVSEQDRTAAYETATEGWTTANVSIAWKPLRGANNVTIMLIGDNLFNVERRRHASFTKDFVPLAGRNVKLSAKLSF